MNHFPKNETLYGCETNNYILKQVQETVYLRKNDLYGEALQLVDKLITEYPSHAECFFLKGDIYRSQNNFKELIENYNIGLELNSNNAINYHTRGFCSIQCGIFNNAINDFTTIIKNKNKNKNLNERDYVIKESYTFRAIAKCCIGSWDNIEKDIEQIPDNFIIYLHSIPNKIDKSRLLTCVKYNSTLM